MQNVRFVVATDLSPPSRDALRLAIAYATRVGGTVDLFCAVPAQIVDEEMRLLDRVKDGVEKLRARAEADGVAACCEVVVARDVPKAIAAHAESSGSAVLVVGPSGVSGWKKFVLGSVTERLLRLAPASLLVARGKSAETPSVILVALDMTPGSTRALRTAAGLAKSCGAKLVALHAVPQPGAALMAAGDVYLPETWALEAERVATVQREFGAWLRRQPGLGPDVEARVVEGNPAEVVVQEAKACGAGLVVVGSHGKTAVHEFFVGSVARSVATHAPVPVLVVRARPPRGGSGRAARKGAVSR